MLAMTYRGPYRVRVTQKPEPQIEHPRDAIFAEIGLTRYLFEPHLIRFEESA